MLMVQSQNNLSDLSKSKAPYCPISLRAAQEINRNTALQRKQRTKNKKIPKLKSSATENLPYEFLNN